MDGRRTEIAEEIADAATRCLGQSRKAALPIPLRLRGDDEVTRFARAGDSAAFDELVMRYRDRVYAFALECVGNEEAAGDVVCEAFVSAYRDRGSVAGGGSPGRWFCVHTLRAVVARRRNGRVRTRTIPRTT
jgi:DNA-directed RNA polymerase specialized sigma24 family protein